jgi:hypothetical protein
MHARMCRLSAYQYIDALVCTGVGVYARADVGACVCMLCMSLIEA